MCGRYTIWDLEELDKSYPLAFETKGKLTPRYNAAPGQFLPTVTKFGVEVMKWGLIPRWAKEPKSMGYSLINARAETLVIKPMYRNLLARNRCLVPANGFFEWQKTKKGKVPQYIFLKYRKMFSFAGLWDQWQDAEGKSFKSYTIITCEANSFISKIHDRMPVILNNREEQVWLSDQALKNASNFLDPYPSTDMQAYSVSTLVNRVANDGPQIIYQLGKNDL